MNAERLIELYEKVAEAPDVVERLRRFVLDLAVRGKLVDQDPEDEPASELLKKIAAEKELLVRAGEIRKSKPLSLAQQNKTKVPSNWMLVPLGELIVRHLGGGTPSKSNENFWGGELRWASVKDVGKSKYLDDTIDRITEEGLANSSSNLIEPGNLLVVTRMGLGKVSINRVPVAINQDCRALYLSKSVSIDYVYNFFLTHGFEGTGLTVKGIKLNELLQIPFPLPPLAEQQRIVAKVEELMALLDRLEATRAARETTRYRLTTASLARLTALDTDPEAFPDHARFALDALPTLTARPDQIQPLRQTILNLAVRGKLVEQDPADEPAAELLRKIAAAKLEARRATGDRRIRDASKPDPTELPMELPAGWAVQSFENLFLFIDYRGKTPPKTEVGIPLITAKNVRMGSLNREPQEFVAERTYQSWMTRGLPKFGDLFFTTEAPLANICVNEIDEPFALAQRVVCFQPYYKISTRFVMYAIMSGLIQALINEHATGLTAKGIKTAKLKPLPLPVPPYAEQKRIVAKLEVLMAFCDQLEVALSTCAASRARLLEAVLHDALGTTSRQREAA